MAQQIYTSIGSNQKKKGRRAVIVLICIIAAVLIALAAVGIITNSQSDARFEVAEAVAENVQLKQQIDYLNGEVERLNAEVERLGGELAARPTIEPSAAPTTEPTASPEAVSPRGYYE